LVETENLNHPDYTNSIIKGFDWQKNFPETQKHSRPHGLIKFKTALQNLPNKACSGFVGVCAVYKQFSGFEFFLLTNRIYPRPQSANANR
jgi:hypothetical protein